MWKRNAELIRTMGERDVRMEEKDVRMEERDVKEEGRENVCGKLQTR